MDLSAITIAQRTHTNQFNFDQDVLEKAILRRENRDQILRQKWSRLSAITKDTAKHLASASKIAAFRQAS